MANAPEVPLYSPGYAGATALGGTPTTPVPMAPPGSTAPEAPGAGEDAGVSALNASGGATLADRMKASGSPFLPNFVTAANAAAKSDPEAAAAPGGWARTVLAGAMHGLAPAASEVVSGLGNAAAVGEIPRGSGKLGGAFVGISRALNAGNIQAAQQKQQKFENQQKTEELGMKEEAHRALMAEGQLRMIQLNQAIQKQDEDVRKESLKGTSAYVQSYVDRGYHQEIMNYEELQKMAKDPDFWKYHTGGKIGETPILDADGKEVKGKDGKTIFNPQYGIIDLRTKPAGSGPHVVSPEESARWANGNVDVPAGTTLQDDQLKVVSAKAEQGIVRNSVVDKANGEVMDDKKREQLRPDFENPTVSKAITQYAGRPVKGVSEMLQATDKQVDALNKQIADAKAKNPNDPGIAQLQQQLETMQSADGSLRRVMQFGLGQKAQEDELKAQQEDEKIRADKETEAIKYMHELNLEKIKAAQGSPGDLAPLLVDGLMDPSQLPKRAATYNATLTAANDYSMSHYGKPYDIAQASTDYKFANQPSTQNTLKYLNSLTGGNDKVGGGNLGELVRQSNGITRTEFPALNDVAAWARLQTGDPSIVGYRTTVAEVADQVAKILQGGGTGSGTSDAKLKQANEMFASGFTKAQIIAVASSLGPLLGNRRDSMIGNNTYLQRQFGKPNAQPAPAAPPKVGDVKTFPNGKKGVWDGKGYAAQP